jgi:hypothetical protein
MSESITPTAISPELALVDPFLVLREYIERSPLNGAGNAVDDQPEPISPELVLVDPVLAAHARELLAREEVPDCLAPRPRPVPSAHGIRADVPSQDEAPPVLGRGVPRRMLAGAAILVVVAGVFTVPVWLMPFGGGAHSGVTIDQLTHALPTPAPQPAPPPVTRVALPSTVHGTARMRPRPAPRKQHPAVSHTAAQPAATTRKAPAPVQHTKHPTTTPKTPAPVQHTKHPTTTPKTPAPVQRTKHPAVTRPKAQTTTAKAPHVRLPPLGWAPVASAVGYHVELMRGARRVFAVTTSRAQLALPSTWSYGGRRYRLVPGEYRWYVWPLFRGAEKATATRGRPIVAATLTVPR